MELKTEDVFEELVKFKKIFIHITSEEPILFGKKGDKLSEIKYHFDLCDLWDRYASKNVKNRDQFTIEEIRFIEYLYSKKIYLIDASKPEVHFDNQPVIYAPAIIPQGNEVLIPLSLEDNYDKYSKERAIAFLPTMLQGLIADHSTPFIACTTKGVNNSGSEGVINALSPLISTSKLLDSGIKYSFEGFVPWDKCTFKNKCAIVTLVFPNENGRHTVRFRVHNPYLQDQFNELIPVLKGVFKGGFKLYPEEDFRPCLIGAEKKLVQAQSPEINKINKDFLSEIKPKISEQLIESSEEKLATKLISGVHRASERSIRFHSIEDFNIGKYSKLKVPKLTQYIAKKYSKRHSSQLEFLAGKHRQDLFGLKFMFKPFALLFLVKIGVFYHFVLETVDEDLATYVWHLRSPNQIGKTYKKIKALLEKEGPWRRDYLTSYPRDFSSIWHLENDYQSWKTKFFEKIDDWKWNS